MENSSSFVVPNSLGLHGLQHPTPPEMSEGWSVYIDDLMAAQDMLLAAGSSSFSLPGAESSSTVSDAASCVPARPWNCGAAAHADEPSKVRTERKLARGSRLAADGPLEDTASSHLSSPQENGEGVGKMAEVKERDQMEGSRAPPTARDSCECSELRRRGLCLVPVSMLIDYLK